MPNHIQTGKGEKYGAKGKLLVTTKNSTAMTVLDWVCGVVLVILGIVYMFNETMSRAMTELAWSVFRSPGAGEVLQIIVMVFLLCCAAVCFTLPLSRCDVYEGGVTGTTKLTLTKGLRKFELSYRDIMNVTVSGKKLKIHTPAGSYEVMATSNRMEAMRIIQEKAAQEKQFVRP
mgnify:FL=1